MSEAIPSPSTSATPPHIPESTPVAPVVVERLDFESVLKEEQDYIKCRRSIAENSKVSSSDWTFGLAFSGGGIRSASFNLGVLQAFAEKKLLGNLDYLSTVSGGGYIGSWIAAWIHRDGNIDRVEKLLTPDRKVNVVPDRKFSDEDIKKDLDYVFDDEPTPLYHLRAYSSYLIPRAGFLSVQSWTLFAIYFRNVLLNLLVIIPLSVAIILAMLFALKVYMVNEFSVVLGVSLIALSLPCFAFAAVWIARSIEDVRISQPSEKIERRTPFATTYVPAVIAIVLGCYLLAAGIHRSDSKWMANIWVNWGTGWTCCFVVFWCAIAGFVHTWVNYKAWRWLVFKTPKNAPVESAFAWVTSSFTAGICLALFCLLSLWFVESISSWTLWGVTIEKESIRLTLIVPLLLLSMGVAETIQIGMLGRLEDPRVREKWSVCNAYCALAGTAWLGLFFVVLILPELFFVPHALWVKFVGPFGWAVSSMVTAYLAHGPASDGKKSSWIDWLIQLGPPIFVVGLLVGISAIVYRCIIEPNADTAGFSDGLNWNRIYWGYVLFFFLVAAFVTAICSRFVDVNVFSLQELYENRLVRTFLGATRPRAQRCGAPFVSSAEARFPDPITDLDSGDDFPLSSLDNGFYLNETQVCVKDLPPILLINTAINRVGDSSLNNQERMAESFTLGSLHCGCPTTQFIRTRDGYGDNIKLGTAFAISGAAVAPNMGYYSSPVLTALLTLFNLRLGAWLGNPLSDPAKPSIPAKGWIETLFKMFCLEPKYAAKTQQVFSNARRRVEYALSKVTRIETDPSLKAGPTAGWFHLFREMLGLTTIDSKYVYLSDGGHFDNLGVYELLRRRSRYIVACDAGADPDGSCNELAMIIRKAFIDFGIEIKIDIDALKVDAVTSLSKRRFAIGKITYPPRSGSCEPKFGHFVYIKMTLDGTESADIRSYKVKHPEFPHRTTADQFFTESKFESFRKLGYEITKELLKINERSFSTHTRTTNEPSVRLSQTKLDRFLEEIAAYGSLNLGTDWMAKCQDLGLRYEELQSRLVSNSNLRHLRAEIDNRTDLFQVIDQIDSIDSIESIDEGDNNANVGLDSRKLRLLQNLASLTSVQRNEDQKNAEGEWIAKAINLLSDVFDSIKLTEYNPNLREGWIRIARRWMLTSTFAEHWKRWKEDFPKVMDVFYEELKSDIIWNPSGH